MKEEVNDINIMIEEHKKTWKKYGCSIMLDSWTDRKSRCFINFLVNSPGSTWFLKSIDVFDTIKNGELMFKHLDEVVEEIGEENVVQVITSNAFNYVNVGMRPMEKKRRLVNFLCCSLHRFGVEKLNIHTNTLLQARQVVKFIYRLEFLI